MYEKGEFFYLTYLFTEDFQFSVDDLDLESFGEKKKKKKKKTALNMKDLEEALPDDKAEVS